MHLTKTSSYLKAFRLLSRMMRSRNGRDNVRFLVAEELASLVYPKYVFSEHARTWLDDADFFAYYEKFVGTNRHAADRKYFLKTLLNITDDLEGDSVECGAYLGATSWLICEHIKSTGKKLYIFDSFEGLSEVLETDGTHWTQGDLTADEQVIRQRLAPYDFVTIFKGWIPDRFADVAGSRISFMHVDVDLYQPTLDSLEFFYPRLVTNGVILGDDYGFNTCPGARRAFDQFFGDKPEKIIEVPTGQCFIIKR